ncbi:unnamed protein product [Rhizoctonia solani]|uniref:Transmembrane protein n=1 Tax=Rhizoctonia solani TaxID=456999 RepID=A0A8H3B7L1_9AGAM|nr:unnamed protein product [Rhizoctonia solani]
MSGNQKRESTTSSVLQKQANQKHANDFEQESGRDTRARTRLIAEGFSNLALIATFFAGVQAQLISVTNSENDGPVAVATNAAFFGGLIFSVFTAVLATLSGRWFSILREDDADYLSSLWLSQDSRNPMKGKELLQKYLDHQIRQMDRVEKGQGQIQVGGPDEPNPQSPEKSSDDFNPMHFNAECILELLKEEKVKDTGMPGCTLRERILSCVLLSPLIACLPTFALFTTGILLLAWDKQPLPVAIFTTVTVFICVVPLCGFFLKHRHKHVISHIYLGRPSL